MLRILDELLWALRREGFSSPRPRPSTPSAGRAWSASPIGACSATRSGPSWWSAAPIATASARRSTPSSRPIAPTRATCGAGSAPGASSRPSSAALRELLDAAAERSGATGDATALAGLLGAESELDHLLLAAGIARTLAPMTSALQAGFFAQRVMEQLELPRAASALRRIAAALREALGDERGAALADALATSSTASAGGCACTSIAPLADRIAEPWRRGAPRRGRALRRPHRARARGGPARGARPRRAPARRRARAAAAGPPRAHRSPPHPPAEPAHGRRPLPARAPAAPPRPAAPHRPLRRLRLGPRRLALHARAGPRRAGALRRHALLRLRQRARRDHAALRRPPAGRGARPHLRRRGGQPRAQLQLRPGARRLRGARRPGRRPAHHGRRPRRRAHQLPRRRRRRGRPPAGAGAPGPLALPEAPGSWGSGDSAMLRYAAAATRVLVARTAKELEIAAREVASRR